jgi:hypothetical protein
MVRDRGMGRWLVAGGLLALLISFCWFLAVVVWGTPETLDLETAGFLCLFLPLFYFASGIPIPAALLGSLCGVGCAFLPRRLHLWQQWIVLLILINLAFFICLTAHVPLPSGPFEAM